MTESEKPLKKKDQIMYDQDDNTQAMIEADRLLAERFQAREQEELTNEEKARFYKQSQLKNKSFAEIQKLFDKAMTRVNMFVDMDTELQKIDDDQEEAKLKELMEVISDEDGVAIDVIPLSTKPPSIVERYKTLKEEDHIYQIIRADGSSKRYSAVIYMLKNFDREDLETLWKIVKARHRRSSVEGRIVRIKRLHDDLRVTASSISAAGNIPKVTNRPILFSTRVNPSTSASGSKPSGNTKNDRISQTPSSIKKNKVEVQSRKVKSNLNKRNSKSKNVCNEHVKHSVKGAKALCSVCNECLFDGNHAMCLIDHVNSMNVRVKSVFKKNKSRKEWKPTGKVFNSVGYKLKPTRRTFTLVENAYPLTRLIATNKEPHRVPIPLEVVSPKQVVTRVYTRRPKVPKSVQNSKPKVVQIVLWYLDSGCSKHMTGDRSQLANFVHKFLSTVKFVNDQVAKIIGYGDYQIGNVIISRVYYVEGVGHNLFSVGQFCDSDLEVAF
ncbi:hypothetical protein Tco_1040854 [Tanacetum coccineum]|uniref:Retrovirus-related Pol polyprotein from transposon TNT 1-94-like beta-barrel domain-containing protein n=1 Tax=Tanacetum coccineum TaxID=301880 RepID=A0ABQ5GFD3_9ASTR